MGLVQALIDLGIIAYALFAIGMLIFGVYALVDPKAIFTGTSMTDVAQGVIFIIGAVVMFLGAIAAHRLLDNLNSGKYFVPENRQQLKKILWVAVISLALQGGTTLWLRLAHIKAIEGFTPINSDSMDSQIAFIIVVLIVYLIFERGIELQEDENNII